MNMFLSRRLMAFQQFQLKLRLCGMMPPLVVSFMQRRYRPLQSARISPSNHQSTALTLVAKKISQKRIIRQEPRKYDKVWGALNEQLLGYCGNDHPVLSAENSLQILRVPLTASYDKEIDFNKALFEALRLCLGSYELQQSTNSKNTIVLKVGNTEKYAVGLARCQNVIAKDLQDDLLLERGAVSVYGASSGAMNEDAKPDHAVCLFQRGIGCDRWVIKDCFSVVELKMSDTNCQNLTLENEQVGSVFLENQHGALGQVILYTLGCVLPYHARRGVLGNYLPLAVIAGKKNKPGSIQTADSDQFENSQENKASRLRWVAGRLDIPIACGQSFEYGVTDFGHFFNLTDEIDDDENASVINALSVYLDTILFGLSRAISVQKNLANDEVMPPVPLSGQSLMIGDTALSLPLCASPIHGANPFPSVRHGNDERWSVSQGELFSGRLNLNGLQRSDSDARFDFYDIDFGEYEEVDVVIKVSSPTVHNMLITPGEVFEALERVKKNRKLVNEIGTVLLSVVWQDVGLITIMADLSKQGYTLLKPREHRDKLCVLWAGYRELVEKVLLPLAEVNVLHPDIRPGYDVTSNVLCKLIDDDNGGKKAIIKLIDYESLVWFRFWNTPEHDGRYINRKRTRDATAFVWWQCVCLAYTWYNELDANSLRKGDHFRALMDDYYGPRNMAWWKEVGVGTEDHNMDSEYVRETLDKLAQMFDSLAV